MTKWPGCSKPLSIRVKPRLSLSPRKVSADLILLDERDGRIAAERAGLRVTGLLGVLLRAKKDGHIQSVKPELELLRTRARFFVSPHLERKILDLAGE
jgi:uncharacterized protein